MILFVTVGDEESAPAQIRQEPRDEVLAQAGGSTRGAVEQGKQT
ncbi:Uncharacterised protein [Mycobacteroides abscessus subsp. massiliense]|nr:Uncharacterised protein [Mycobacteroides abscessus subsp. massiliense]